MIIGNIKEVLTEEFMNKCRQLALKFNHGNRSFEQVLENTKKGYAVETIVNKFLDLEESGKIEYDSIDKKTGEKYEIKHTSINSEYWTYNPFYYQYFLDNAHNIDYIVLCYLDEDKNVHIRCIADAPTFEQYSIKTHLNSYYDKLTAMKNEACILY